MEGGVHQLLFHLLVFMDPSLEFVQHVITLFGNKNELSKSMVQRFEWFADGASEFLRYVEDGGTPHCHTPFKSLIRNLLAGMELQHKIVWGNEYPSYLLWLVPVGQRDHRLTIVN